MTEISREPNEERFSEAVPSPLGPLLIVVRGHTVVGLYHQDHDPPPKSLLLGRTIHTPDQGKDGPLFTEGQQPKDQGDRMVRCPEESTELLRRAAHQVGEYFAGTRKAFDLPLMPEGTTFQLRVWSALAKIPYGERRSYGDIASELGNANMGRAIGAAVRANPLSIIVPGHRVVSRAGGVIGYAAGMAAKEALLELESGEARMGAGYGAVPAS